MRLRLTKRIVSAAVAFAVVALATATHADAAEGEYVVSSEVVSDTAVPGGTYVGDMSAASAGCSGGDYGTCQGGSCANGQCSSGQCGSGQCGSGQCGSGQCGSGQCGAGGCGKGGGLCNGIVGDDGLGFKVHGGRGPIGCQPRKYDRPDLFYNYYSQGNCNRANAQMYLSPQPVPPFVGHTYFTYQPFYPHEYMYWHKNRFHNFYDNGRGMNRTKAVYYAPPIHTAIENFYWNKLRLPR